MSDPYDYALWYEQFLKLDVRKREEIREKALKILKRDKPETFEFIKKFKCELVGLSPRIEYAMIDGTPDEIETTWVHAFGIPTLLYWCNQGKFGLFVNANLEYNDSVLKQIPGNKIEDLKGFTG